MNRCLICPEAVASVVPNLPLKGTEEEQQICLGHLGYIQRSNAPVSGNPSVQGFVLARLEALQLQKEYEETLFADPACYEPGLDLKPETKALQRNLLEKRDELTAMLKHLLQEVTYGELRQALGEQGNS